MVIVHVPDTSALHPPFHLCSQPACASTLGVILVITLHTKTCITAVETIGCGDKSPMTRPCHRRHLRYSILLIFGRDVESGDYSLLHYFCGVCQHRLLHPGTKIFSYISRVTRAYWNTRVASSFPPQFIVPDGEATAAHAISFACKILRCLSLQSCYALYTGLTRYWMTSARY